MKVLAEIMDAHWVEDIAGRAEQYFSCGADIVDLGFGFDATQDDVKRVFSAVDGIDRPLAVDTQDPALIPGGALPGRPRALAPGGKYPEGGEGRGPCGSGGRGSARQIRLRKTSPGHGAPGSVGSLPIPSSSRSVQDWSPRLHSLRTMAARSSLARETWPNSSMQTRSASMRSFPAWQRRPVPRLSSRANTRTRPGVRSGRCGGQQR